MKTERAVLIQGNAKYKKTQSNGRRNCNISRTNFIMYLHEKMLSLERIN